MYLNEAIIKIWEFTIDKIFPWLIKILIVMGVGMVLYIICDNIEAIK